MMWKIRTIVSLQQEDHEIYCQTPWLDHSIPACLYQVLSQAF